jgi:hypothetical protein
MGENLYERKDACIRELLQNAVDACRMRRELLKKEGLDYKPEVTFELISDGKIIVSDNGTGMDEYIVENYFAQIGRCFYTSPDFQSKDLCFSPVSRYGIGILSCFMIADKLEVETKIEGSEPLFIEIDKMFDYFIVKEGKKRNMGTTATLFLKEEVKRDIEEGKFDLERTVRYYARHLEFPVKVKVPEKEAVVIEDKGYVCDVKYLYLHRPMAVSTGYAAVDKEKFNLALSRAERIFGKTCYEIPINEKDMEGVIGISLTNIVGYGKLGCEALISNNGIFICGSPISIGDLWGVFLDLNIKSGIVDFNISKSDVISNQKFYKFENNVFGLINKGFERFFEEFKDTITPFGLFNLNLLRENYEGIL